MWSIKDEINFFNEAVKLLSIENLMVKVDEHFYAFQPKSNREKINTPQARNSLIGFMTEKWCKDFLCEIASKNNLYAVNGVVCSEIGLFKYSPADLAFCTTPDTMQQAQNIKLIFEIKMGIVNNYIFDKNDGFKFCGDYTTHRGSPSLLRSDSMLKAIGKSINIRIESMKKQIIPIVVIGNSPISKNYLSKVDNLKRCGIIQKFISLYPKPTEKDFIQKSPFLGFETFQSANKVENFITELLNKELNYFSSMISYNDLGKIISQANEELTDEMRGKRFIELLNI